MDAGADQGSSRLTDMLTARVPAGFGDQIRAAARAEGVRPGALIREAVSERIARAGVPAMNDDDRARVRDFGGDRLVSVVERAEADPEFRDRMEREVEAHQFKFMDKVLAAHRHLSDYITGQSALVPGQPVSSEAASTAIDHLSAAYREMAGALRVETELGSLVLNAEG